MTTKSKFFGYINKDKTFGVGLFVEWYEYKTGGKKLKNVGLAYGPRVVGVASFVQ